MKIKQRDISCFSRLVFHWSVARVSPDLFASLPAIVGTGDRVERNSQQRTKDKPARCLERAVGDRQLVFVLPRRSQDAFVVLVAGSRCLFSEPPSHEFSIANDAPPLVRFTIAISGLPASIAPALAAFAIHRAGGSRSRLNTQDFSSM